VAEEYDPTTEIVPEWDPDAAEPRPILPAGKYGAGTPDAPGQAYLERVTFPKGVTQKGNKWASVGLSVRVITEEHGTGWTSSDLFPPGPNTSMTANSDSSWPQIAANLGITPGMTAADILGPEGKVAVIVESIVGKDNRDGSPKAIIKMLWKA
jgi:hypothetical protein